MENLRPGRKIFLFSNLMPVVLLLVFHCGSRSLAGRLGPHKNCLTCKDGHYSGAGRASRDHTGTGVLTLGEPCGVYTLSCAKGLRCVPPPKDHSPLQALLQGRGFCAKQGKLIPTEKPQPTGKPSDAFEVPVWEHFLHSFFSGAGVSTSVAPSWRGFFFCCSILPHAVGECDG